MPPEKTFPLSQAQAGQQVRLVSIHGGRQLTHRLVEMGLTPGVTVRILQNSGGPLLVAESDSRIAVGRGMADKIDVVLEAS
jgi:ferrous iron transport protein A